MVTHDLGLAWNIADRIAVMYLGRVVECGTTEEVLESPRHPYTQALLSVVPEMEQLEPVVLTGEIPDPTRIPPVAGSTRAARPSPTGAQRGRGSPTSAGPSRWSRFPRPVTTASPATSTLPARHHHLGQRGIWK